MKPVSILAMAPVVERTAPMVPSLFWASRKKKGRKEKNEKEERKNKRRREKGGTI